MDNNNWRAAQAQAQAQVQLPVQANEAAAAPGAAMDTGDWRSQLHPDSRQRIVIKIMDTLKRHLPFSGQEGLQERKKIAERFEEKIYIAATSQSDYLRKISLKMLTMGTKSQTPMANSMQTNPANSSKNPTDSETELMDNNNWWAAQAQAQVQLPVQANEAAAAPGAAMDTGDWRSHLQLDSRQRIVIKIMDTLKRHLPFSGQEGLQELKKIAERFEEKIYTAATSQSDYLRKISLKMLTMETKSQTPMANNMQTNPANSSKNPTDSGDIFAD